MRITNEDKVYFPERGLTKVTSSATTSTLRIMRCRTCGAGSSTWCGIRTGSTGSSSTRSVPAKTCPYDECFVQFPSGHSTVFAVLDNKSALEWVANLGCLELHTWHSRVPEIEKPDYLLIDLDPSADGQWPYVRQIALVVREVMDELGLASYPKTSGATGMHILAPIKPELDSRRCGASRKPWPRRWSGASATRRSRRRRGGSATAGRLRRLRPELARQDDRDRLLGAADA